MLKYTLKRILWIIPVLLGVILVVFAISYFAPGDPVLTILGTTAYTPEKYEQIAHSYGLDQPFFVQYLNYLKNVFLHFDFGTSYALHNSIGTQILTRAPYSIKLGVFSILLMVIIAIPVGVVSAVKQNTWLDRVITVVSMFFAGMPNFWFALLLMLFFAVQLKWLPATGVGSWKNWVLPVVSLSLTSMASTLRMTRSSVLEVIRQDYVRTARAKGLSEQKTIIRHVLKNSLIPVLTVVGMHLGTIIGGSVIIENIFNMPGIGSYMLTGINNRDYPVINGCVLVLSLSVCVVNLIVDLLYAAVDPRIKAQYEAMQKKRTKQPRARSTRKEAA